MKVSIIDYGAGNIKSIQFAFKRLGVEAKLTSSIEELFSSDRVIFPGVGEASFAMNRLTQNKLDQVIPQLTQPVLGICLGMQLLCNKTEEGNTKGLGVFNTNIKRFSSIAKNDFKKASNNEEVEFTSFKDEQSKLNLDYRVKVPQMGWNTIKNLKTRLFDGVKEDEYMYLVHSYYAENCKEQIASTNYGISYASALNKDNFYGVQFHPEKSGLVGEKILSNFLSL
ncbi:imidazole glycerol phosphate synthase subunit HisH [Pseudofulvibacter geojedonensis]|uniref:Imidazole glycerol phosphate synthase subunit HisH n=1 Tax=Pseudofulvibacter geojedonensis TaxID=1123758 RepID=A0ABW3I2H7_9FLAO